MGAAGATDAANLADRCRMTKRATKLLHIDGIAEPVSHRVWATFRTLSAQLASMARIAEKQADRIAELEAEIDRAAAA